MIDPKALDISSLPSVYLESKSELPRESAIYFAIDSQGNIQYIGRSSDIKQRWMKHHRFSQLTSIGNIRIAYLCMDADILPSVEKALIEWFRPSLNQPISKRIRMTLMVDPSLKKRIDQIAVEQNVHPCVVIEDLLKKGLALVEYEHERDLKLNVAA